MNWLTKLKENKRNKIWWRVVDAPTEIEPSLRRWDRSDLDDALIWTMLWLRWVGDAQGKNELISYVTWCALQVGSEVEGTESACSSSSIAVAFVTYQICSCRDRMRCAWASCIFCLRNGSLPDNKMAGVGIQIPWRITKLLVLWRYVFNRSLNILIQAGLSSKAVGVGFLCCRLVL